MDIRTRVYGLAQVFLQFLLLCPIGRPQLYTSGNILLPSLSPRSPLALPSLSPRSPLALPSLSPRSPLALPSLSPRLPSLSPRSPLALPSLSPPSPFPSSSHTMPDTEWKLVSEKDLRAELRGMILQRAG